MQRKYQTHTIGVCLIILFAGWLWPKLGSAADALDQASKNQLTTGLLNKEILIRPQLNKLNFGFGRYNSLAFVYEKTISKLFFQDKELNANVVDISIEGSEITLDLSHPVLGTGSVNFSFDAKFLKQATPQQVRQILIETLGDENHQYVLLDPDTKLYHLWSCNHFTEPHLASRMKRADAEAQGYRPSAVCFKKVLYLPDISVERAIEAEWTLRLGNYEPVKRGSEKQDHLSAVGHKVLKGWPLKLLGYDYAFDLAQSHAINAFAIPTGRVIVTAALFDSLNSDEELEALLAYAIAHIEQRHSLKKYYDCLEDEEYTDAVKKLASVAGVLAGPAGGGIFGALDIALPSESCSPQSLMGYDTDFIQQADAMVALYFDIHQKERQAIVSVIKKLRFSELAQKLHPDMRLRGPINLLDNTRIRRVKNIKFKYYRKGNHFVLRRSKRPPVQINLKYHQIFEDENKMHFYLDEKAILELNRKKNNKTVTWLSISDKNGSHRFALQPNLLTEDMWGAHLTFSATGQEKKKFLQGIDKMLLTLNPTSGQYEKPHDKPIENYPFVPGAIEW